VAAVDTTATGDQDERRRSFPVGAILGPTDEGDGGSWDEYTHQIPQVLKWAVTDNSGAVCEFYVWQVPEEWWTDDPQTEGSTPDYASGPGNRHPGRVSSPVCVSDYDGGFGDGGSTHEGWVMRAIDCADNAASVKIQSSEEITVLNDDNYYPNRDTLNPGQISYAGTWRNQLRLRVRRHDEEHVVERREPGPYRRGCVRSLREPVLMAAWCGTVFVSATPGRRCSSGSRRVIAASA
jgi:hypothetical protein